MAYERNPDDPYRPNPADDPYRRADRLDSELQPDPELAEGPASGAKVRGFLRPEQLDDQPGRNLFDRPEHLADIASCGASEHARRGPSRQH